MKEKISVIVPIYKVEKYLSNCIESILKQTYKNLEVILVDDGSPDNCPLICDNYAKKDNRIKVIHKKNGGVSDARNVGLDNATGNYIYFADPDDCLEYTILEKMSLKMDCNFVICNHLVNRNGHIIKKDSLKQGYIKKNDLYKYINQKNYFCGYVWNKMYSKKIIDKMELRFEKKIYILEDLVFNCKYISSPLITKGFYIDEYLYTYYIRNNSLLNNIDFNNDKVLKNKMTIFDAIKVLLDLYAVNSFNNINSIKERYIKTTYQYIFFLKKSKCDLSILKDEIKKSKHYYKYIKNTLSFKSKLKLFFNMKFPYLYGYLGSKRRVE